MDKARKALSVGEEDSSPVSSLDFRPQRPGDAGSFYEGFALRGIRLDQIRPGSLTCTFKVPPRLTLRSIYEPKMEPIQIPYMIQAPLVRGEIGVPDIRRKAGRPKKNRIKSGESLTMELHCSNCGAMGHNRRRCTSQPREPNY